MRKKWMLWGCCVLLAALCACAAGAEEPLWTVEGSRLTVREGILRLGEDPAADGVEGLEEIPPEGDAWVWDLFMEGVPTGVRQIVLPSSLRQIGAGGLFGLSGQELILSGSPEYFSKNAMDGWVRRIVLEADYTGVVPQGGDCAVSGWEVREGNPVYASRDGVLFSADGKILYDYCSGREELHYDVPAGTEEIADGAFSDGYMGIPLQTISLPIGLRRIGAYAFSGCGRLHSLTVPLTVTDLDPTAFDNCVSLERLSLPPGLKASWDEDYALHEDLSHYMGDNGATLTTPRKTDNFGRVEEVTPVTASVWLSGENGEGPVPVYASPEAETPVGEKESGTAASYTKVSGGRARIWDFGNEAWIDLANLLPAGRWAFFDEARPEPTEEGMAALREQGMESYDACWVDEEELWGVFVRYAQVGTEEDTEAYLPLDQVKLYRERVETERTFALLVAEDPHQPIRLLDAPGGAPVGWTYRGEQAEVTETDGDWARIRTIALTGWVPAENVAIVEPAPAEK